MNPEETTNQDVMASVRADSQAMNLPPTPAITGDSLTPEQAVNLPEMSPVLTTPAQPTNLAEGMVQDLQKTKAEEEAQRFQERAISTVFDDIQNLQGQTKMLASERERLGVNEKLQALQANNARINELAAEINKDDVELAQQLRAEETRDTLLPFANIGKEQIAGDAKIVRALKTAEIGVLNARSLALQGDVDLARQMAQDAVDAKYAPYRERIALYEKALEVVQPLLDSAEAKEAANAKRKADAALREIEKREATEKGIQEIALEIAKNGGNPSLVNDAKTVSEAIQLGAKYMSDPLDAMIKRAQLTNTNLSIAKNREELNVLKAQIAAAENSNGLSFASLSDKQQDTVFKLRDKYNSESKDFVVIRDAYNRILASADDPSAAGDLALIFNYMKVLDPGSTVREGEFATAQNSAGLPAIVRAKYNSVLNGQRLADEQRADFVERSTKLFEAQQKQQQKINENYSFLSSSANIPSEFVVRDISSAVTSEEETLGNIYNATIGTQNSSTQILDGILNRLSPQVK